MSRRPRTHGFLILICSVGWGCAGPSGPDRIPTGAHPVGQASVAVVEFELEGASVTYNEPTDAFGIAISEQIAAALRRRKIQAVVAPAGEPATGDLVVTGRVSRIDAGSRSQRYWIGFGAGAAKFGVVGSVHEADGDEVATFSHERWAGSGAFGGASASLVQKCMRAVAKDVARMIETGEYTRVGE